MLNFLFYKKVNTDLNKILKILSIRFDFQASLNSPYSFSETLEKNIWQSKDSAFHIS